MHISRFKLSNFKSYRDGSPIEFTRGLNVIVGQNNAGKSALLEALTLSPPWNPHRSPKAMTFEGAPPAAGSSLEVSFAVSRTELIEIMISMGGVSSAYSGSRASHGYHR
jgi:recombinational DNA repair ATPase RecF